MSVKLKHIVSIEDISTEDILGLIDRAIAFKRGVKMNVGAQTFVANMFFENSTRTQYSFEVAEKKIGCEVVNFNAQASSVQKGETLYDTVLTFSSLGIDIAVIRHPEDKYYQELIDSKTLKCSFINGGDGSGQHPSQCLLDMVTIKEEFGHFKGLKVAIVGDLSHSRVARSNMELLNRLGAEVYFSGPLEWYNPTEFNKYGTYLPIDDLVEKVDVMMMLRVQHERHGDETSFSKSVYHKQYGLTVERYEKMKYHSIVMHPAPVNRDVEIDGELVEALRSRIAAQMENGVFTRMAMLEAVINYRSENLIQA
ncbi:MAG: aspartate carbamoyltransferase catalytic subunit [Lactobacillales bacterium]|jgi:aspartate carbamoyltransferase catalytic subunit|nr:aspartate carbamoyltransferase catalytic subunit [Lactobacillales bacterium]